VTPGLTHVLVASMLRQKIYVYSRDPATNDLKLDHRIPLHSSPDNLSWDDEGNLWVAAHPNLISLMAMSHKHKRRGPAQILKVTLPLSEKPTVKTVFSDDGRKISAVSVAKPAVGVVVLGTVFDSRHLVCKPK
jgi:arylesterase / paraoxonase